MEEESTEKIINKTPQMGKSIPPQSSPTDTSNWDDREFATPSGRIVIETDQALKDDKVVAD